jgi:hypothetical protein
MIAGKFSTSAPLARLVLFMICLSLAGSFVSVSHYVLVDRPIQEYGAHPPENKECDWMSSFSNDLELMYTIASSWFGGYHIVWTNSVEKRICCKYN